MKKNMMNNGEYYIYGHYADGILFYIGRGKNKRAWDNKIISQLIFEDQLIIFSFQKPSLRLCP